MAEFLQTAVYNGLVKEKFPTELVAAMLNQKDSLFVPNCKICENVQAGMQRYLDEQSQLENLKSLENWNKKNGAERCYSFQMNVYRFVNDEIALRSLSGSQLERLNSDLAVAKKGGMSQKHLSQIPARYCPSCEGATKR